jgi:FKBP-type peptidyl-prolyl cis-trans isomerase FklB
MRLGKLAIVGMALLAGRAEDGDDPVLEAQQEKLAKQAQPAKAAAEARKQGEAFLAENARKEGVVTLPSGLQYKVLRPGHGRTPTDADRVVCHYRGTLLDGTQFDSSYGRGRPMTFEMARVIPGLREALRLMPVGSKWQLFVPPGLAYGERGMRSRKRSPSRVGPNATLIFETELLAIRPGQASPGTRTVD